MEKGKASFLGKMNCRCNCLESQGTLELHSCWCQYRDPGQSFWLKNPTIEKRRGRRSGIDFFKHLAKTTNWNAEKKYSVSKEVRMSIDLRYFVLWILFLLVYLLSLSWWS